MSTIMSSSFTSDLFKLSSGDKGPVTASRHRRNALVYTLLCALAITPFYLGLAASWQAAGLGLLVPGGGFLALGGWKALLFPLTLALFWVSIVAWFWAGMVVAPLGIWFGTAALAGVMAGDAIWAPSIYLAPAGAAAVFAVLRYRVVKQRAKDREHFKFRQTFFPASLAEVQQQVAVEPIAGERELSAEQLMNVRYLLDLALQPVGEYKGYTVIDQFQPAALRYQINHVGFGLGIVQGHYTPSFKGYLDKAQRNVIETYREKKVWGYWVLESMWGHLNFKNFDPVIRDNIMLSGWYGMHVGQYMLNSGDKTYAKPGSLTFRLNDKHEYKHDIHTNAKAVARNFERSDYCLFPCEPNWVYPICNMYGLSALAVHDSVFKTNLAAKVLPQWMHMLNTEFTDEKGSIVGLRSYWTGLAMPFYSGEAGFAFFANVISPELGHKLWAVGRKELGFCLVDGPDGKKRLTLPAELLSFMDTIDAGNYRKGVLFAYAAIMISAREFGDNDLAEAAERSMDQDCGPIIRNGVARYTKGSCLANVWAAYGRLMRTGDFRNSFVKGPPASVFTGPILTDVTYPEVLVAKAFSDGDDLELVLYPGAGEGVQGLRIERLNPGATYQVQGAQQNEFTADSSGCVSLQVALSGRTPIYIAPKR